MCKYKKECNVCAGHISTPDTCARYAAAENVGILNVPADISPIDYMRAAMLKAARQAQLRLVQARLKVRQALMKLVRLLKTC